MDNKADPGASQSPNAQLVQHAQTAASNVTPHGHLQLSPNPDGGQNPAAQTNLTPSSPPPWQPAWQPWQAPPPPPPIPVFPPPQFIPRRPDGPIRKFTKFVMLSIGNAVEFGMGVPVDKEALTRVVDIVANTFNRMCSCGRDPEANQQPPVQRPPPGVPPLQPPIGPSNGYGYYAQSPYGPPNVASPTVPWTIQAQQQKLQ
ncbi:hypothetical protein C0993_008792 [Termitomyces sp. T159_Od127]|nr:hypothetical protein C0993_008792 [Termitomyces sp. T159_Od127]